MEADPLSTRPRGCGYHLPVQDLETAVRAAIETGRDIDLSGCIYGPPHWDGPSSLEPPPYYYLLAGLVRSQGCERVVELGTHAGGATLAMARGLPASPNTRIVTVDVTAIPNAELDADRRVVRIHGDAFAPATLRRVRELAGGPVDLLFIDIVHGYHQTKRAIGLYANALQPRLMALDDVALGAGMRAVWEELARAHPSVDCSATLERPEIGFGIVAPKRPVRLDEGDAWRVALWGARRAISARLSYRFKARVMNALERVSPRLRRFVDPS